jgi:hypothetical protein
MDAVRTVAFGTMQLILENSISFCGKLTMDVQGTILIPLLLLCGL